jgi:hypothetical protein
VVELGEDHKAHAIGVLSLCGRCRRKKREGGVRNGTGWVGCQVGLKGERERGLGRRWRRWAGEKLG